MNKKIFKFTLFLFLYILCIMLLSTNKSNAEERINDGVYRIRSAVSKNYVLDVTDNSQSNCANVEIWGNNEGENQKFYIKSVSNGYYTIKAVHSGKYIDVEKGSKVNGANVLQYDYNGASNQMWLIKSAGDGYYHIISKCSGLYLDVDNGVMSNGRNVLTWSYNGGLNQKFKLDLLEDEVNSGKDVSDGVYKIASAQNRNYVLDVTGDSRSNCANIELWSSNEGNNQKFYIKKDGNGYYTISAASSNKYLDVDNGSKKAGANVLQYDYHGADNQKWTIKSAGDGYYYIVSKCSGLYLDAENASMRDGTNILTWNYNGGANQKFKLTPTTAVDEGRSDKFKREHPNIKVGIDVSRYQGKIDWNAVKKDGIDYVMVRAGFRGYGESGTLNVDTMFEENVRGARAAGLDVGVYFFSQAKNMEEGIKEAEYTIGLIKKFDINYPVAFDTEESSSPTNTGRADNISVKDRTDATKGFCSTIEKAGYKTLIYASPYWLKNKLDLSQLSQYKIWLANYTGATQDDPLKRPSSYKGDYVMWQYTSNGTVDGVDGAVDCDIYYYMEQD